MATGVVSLDLHLAGLAVASTVLLALAAAIDGMLLLSGGLLREMAGVPAVAVIGSGLAARGGPAWPLLVVAAALWTAHLPRLRLPERAGGLDLLPVVATQAVVVLAGDVQRRAGGVEGPAIALLCAGALGYVVIIARFDRRAVFGGAGDQWIAGGAAAITALACATLAGDGDGDMLDIACVIAWVAAILWLPYLVAGELHRPRLGALGRRWSTVFPVGMYAAMSFAVAATTRLPAVHAFALAWTAVAAVVWAVVAAAAASRCAFAARLTGARRGR